MSVSWPTEVQMVECSKGVVCRPRDVQLSQHVVSVVSLPLLHCKRYL